MSKLLEKSSYLSSLRERATTQLTEGVSADLTRASTSEAMGVLFTLASSHDTAGDAMALLHELQVHQVEVEIQHEELLRSRGELENDLIRLTNRFDRAPAGYLLVDEKSVLCEVNQMGIRLLGIARDELLGRSFTGFLSDDSGQMLDELLARAKAGEAPEAIELELLPSDAATRKVCASASLDGLANQFMLVIMPLSSEG